MLSELRGDFWRNGLLLYDLRFNRISRSMASRAAIRPPRVNFRYQLIYRPIFQFEAVFVRWRAESSILFSFDTQLNRRVKASQAIELGRTVCG